MATRKCIGDDLWADPDVLQCQTIEQAILMMRAEELNNIVSSSLIFEDRDMTVEFMPKLLVEIATELDEITDTSKSQPLLRNDITTSAITLNIVIM